MLCTIEALKPWLAQSCRIELIPVSVSWCASVFLHPRRLDRMVVHRRSLPRNLLGFPNNSPIHINTLGWREKLHVWELCLAQEHNIMSPTRARTRTTFPRVCASQIKDVPCGRFFLDRGRKHTRIKNGIWWLEESNVRFLFKIRKFLLTSIN